MDKEDTITISKEHYRRIMELLWDMLDIKQFQEPTKEYLDALYNDAYKLYYDLLIQR